MATPDLSVTGPWPGTTVSMSIPSIRSHASTQFCKGPAHTTGVPPADAAPITGAPIAGEVVTLSTTRPAGTVSLICAA